MTLIRARIVLPVTSAPIENGAIAIDGRRVSWVGRFPDAPFYEASNVFDLGDAILLPGLINAHCHLDYTALAGKIPPLKSFTDWIKSLVALKAEWTIDDYARSWRQGAEMLLRSGTTTVADIEAVVELLPSAWSETPLRIVSFREIINLKPDGAQEMAARTAVELAACAGAEGHIGLSPHAPYTTTTELLRASAAEARQRAWRLTTHVAESAEEFDMFTLAGGPLYQWLQSQRDMRDCGNVTPVQHLEKIGYMGEDLLAVHVNYLGPNDAETLSKAGVHVVHCPRSHAYFGHRAFPFETLTAQNVNVCLGTDSLVTVRSPPSGPPTLNLFLEMGAFSRRFPDVAPNEVLRMATLNAAIALGRRGALGELRQNATADVIAIPFTGAVSDVYEASVHHAGPVTASMIRGQWAITPDATGLNQQSRARPQA